MTGTHFGHFTSVLQPTLQNFQRYSTTIGDTYTNWVEYFAGVGRVRFLERAQQDAFDQLEPLQQQTIQSRYRSLFESHITFLKQREAYLEKFGEKEVSEMTADERNVAMEMLRAIF